MIILILLYFGEVIILKNIALKKIDRIKYIMQFILISVVVLRRLTIICTFQKMIQKNKKKIVSAFTHFSKIRLDF